MTWHVGYEVPTRIGEPHEEFRFRSLDTLTRRFGGTKYQIVHDPANRPTRYKVEILRHNRKAGGWDILTVVSVPAAATDPDEEESTP